MGKIVLHNSRKCCNLDRLRELYQEVEDRIEGIEEDVLQGFVLDLGMIW